MSGARFFRRSIAELVPYEPGKPIEEVQRELGLDRVVKLASNEGTYGPFPAAIEALERQAPDLNRYPDGGAYALRVALAERHGVRFEQVAIGSGADGVIDCLSQAVLDEGDEVVCGWPSFPSYVIAATKLGARSVRVPLRDHRYDLDALLGAITPQTKLVYVCVPNNPTGTTNGRAELDALPGPGPGTCPDRPRPGVRRVHRRSRLPGRHRGVLQGRPARDRPPHVLEDLRPRRAARRLRRRARGRGARDRQGAPRVRRLLGGAGRGACEPRRRAGARAPPRGVRPERERSSCKCSSEPASTSQARR